jgi:hypothetical protein
VEISLGKGRKTEGKKRKEEKKEQQKEARNEGGCLRVGKLEHHDRKWVSLNKQNI